MDITWPAVDVGSVSTLSVLFALLVLFATGKVLSRRVADQEQSALIAGHASKDEAHAERMLLRDEQIAELRESNRRKDEIIERRDEQMKVLLDEVAPALQMWAEGIERASKGGGEHVASQASTDSR